MREMCTVHHRRHGRHGRRMRLMWPDSFAARVAVMSSLSQFKYAREHMLLETANQGCTRRATAHLREGTPTHCRRRGPAMPNLASPGMLAGSQTHIRTPHHMA